MQEIRFHFYGTEYSVATSGELMAMLEVLDPEQDGELLDKIGPGLQKIISSPVHLKEVFRMLGTSNQLILIRYLGSSLQSILEHADNLSELLSITSELDVEKQLFDILGTDGLRKLVKTSEQAGAILEWVYDEGDEYFCNIIGMEYLLNISRSGHSLSLILNSMHPDLIQKLISGATPEYMNSILHTPNDLGYLMRAMPSAVSRMFIEKAGDDLIKNVFRHPDDLKSISGFLEEEEYHYLYSKLNTHAN